MPIHKPLLPFALAFGLVTLSAAHALAHCDSLDGPVVKAAQQEIGRAHV